MNDKINPQHYQKGKIETIEIILDTVQHLDGKEAYLVGNILKYISRYNFKNGAEDLEKARWYLNKLLEVIKVENIRDGES